MWKMLGENLLLFTINSFSRWHSLSPGPIMFPSNLAEVTNCPHVEQKETWARDQGVTDWLTDCIYWQIHHSQTQQPLSHAVTSQPPPGLPGQRRELFLRKFHFSSNFWHHRTSWLQSGPTFNNPNIILNVIILSTTSSTYPSSNSQLERVLTSLYIWCLT